MLCSRPGADKRRAQLLGLYAPASLEQDSVREVSMPHPPPCDAEDLVYKNTSAFLSTEVYFYEEEGSSTFHNDPTRQAIHRHARQHVQRLHRERGNLT